MSCHARPAKSSIMPEGAASAHPTPIRWSPQTVAAYQRPVVNRQWPLANCKWVRVNIGGDDLITKHQRHINDTYSHHMPELKETSMCPRVLWELAPIGLSVDLSLVESITFSNVTQHVAGEGIEFISGTGLRTYREEFWALDVSIKVPHFSIPCHIWNSAQPYLGALSGGSVGSFVVLERLIFRSWHDLATACRALWMGSLSEMGSVCILTMIRSKMVQVVINWLDLQIELGFGGWHTLSERKNIRSHGPILKLWYFIWS